MWQHAPMASNAGQVVTWKPDIKWPNIIHFFVCSLIFYILLTVVLHEAFSQNFDWIELFCVMCSSLSMWLFHPPPNNQTKWALQPTSKYREHFWQGSFGQWPWGLKVFGNVDKWHIVSTAICKQHESPHKVQIGLKHLVKLQTSYSCAALSPWNVSSCFNGRPMLCMRLACKYVQVMIDGWPKKMCHSFVLHAVRTHCMWTVRLICVIFSYH